MRDRARTCAPRWGAYDGLMQSPGKSATRAIALCALALSVCLGGPALAGSPASHKGPPRMNCRWGENTYTFGAYCSSDCSGGVCRVQLCLNDGSFMLVGGCPAAKCSPPCL